MFVLSLLCVTCDHSSIAIILKRTRNLVALLLLSYYRCRVTLNVLWLFFMVPTVVRSVLLWYFLIILLSCQPRVTVM